MEKEPYTKFCRVLISSHEVMKLQSFKCNMSDVILANAQNISFLVFFAYICNFMEKEPFTQFFGPFDHF